MKHIVKVLLVCLLAGGMAPVWGAEIDQPSPWAKASVEKLQAWGRIDASFFKQYQSPMTRQEFAGLSVTLYEALSGKDAPAVSDDMKHTFKDTENIEVLQAWQLGIVGGDGHASYRPSAPVTREEMALMLVKLADKAGKSLQPGDKAMPTFQDAAVSPWAQNAIALCLSQGILNGSENGFLNPQGNVTREQAYKTIVNLMELKSTLNP